MERDSGSRQDSSLQLRILDSNIHKAKQNMAIWAGEIQRLNHALAIANQDLQQVRYALQGAQANVASLSHITNMTYYNIPMMPNQHLAIQTSIATQHLTLELHNNFSRLAHYISTLQQHHIQAHAQYDVHANNHTIFLQERTSIVASRIALLEKQKAAAEGRTYATKVQKAQAAREEAEREEKSKIEEQERIEADAKAAREEAKAQAAREESAAKETKAQEAKSAQDKKTKEKKAKAAAAKKKSQEEDDALEQAIKARQEEDATAQIKADGEKLMITKMFQMCKYVDTICKHNPQLMLKQDPDINNLLYSGNTYLHHAVMQSNIQVVETLIAMGAEHNIQNRKGKIPLSLSQNKAISTILKNPPLKKLFSIEPDEELLQHLMKSSSLEHNITPIRDKAFEEEALRENIKQLLDPNCLFEWSYNIHLLLKAISLNSVEIVKDLLQQGINPHIKDCVSGLTAFDILNKSTNPEIIQLLRNHLTLSEEQEKIYQAFLKEKDIASGKPYLLGVDVVPASAAAAVSSESDSTQTVEELLGDIVDSAT